MNTSSSRSFSLSLGSLLMGLTALTGCYSYQLTQTPKPPLDVASTVPAGMGRVCVLRPQSLEPRSTIVVRDNEELVGATRGSGYFCYLAEPGEHHITAEASDMHEAWVTVNPGHDYYLQETITNTFQTLQVELSWIDQRAARELARDCTYQMLVGVPGKENLPPPVPVAKARTEQPAHTG